MDEELKVYLDTYNTLTEKQKKYINKRINFEFEITSSVVDILQNQDDFSDKILSKTKSLISENLRSRFLNKVRGSAFDESAFGKIEDEMDLFLRSDGNRNFDLKNSYSAIISTALSRLGYDDKGPYDKIDWDQEQGPELKGFFIKSFENFELSKQKEIYDKLEGLIENGNPRLGIAKEVAKEIINQQGDSLERDDFLDAKDWEQVIDNIQQKGQSQGRY